VRLWDPATGQPGPVLTGHTSAVLGVCVLPGRAPGQPSLLASAGDDGTVRLWDPATGQPGPVFTGHTGIVFGVCVLPGRSPRLASAGSDGTVRLWDAATGWAVGDPLVRSPEAVRSLAPCAAVLADCVTAHGDGRVRGWTAATATSRIVTFPTSPREVSAIATLITAEHLGLLTGDAYGWVHLIDLRTGHQLGPPVRASEQAVITLCPLPGRPPVTRFAAAGSCGTITIVTVSAAGRLESGPTLRGPASPIRALCPITCHDGRVLLAAAGNAATIWVWDLTTTDASAPKARVTVARATGPLTGHDGWIWSLAAIPAQPGQPPRLASAGADQTIRLWDPLSGHTLGQPLTGHTGQVRAIITASSDDGHMVLVSGAHDGTIRLWDPLTGTPGTVIPLGIPVHALLQQSPSPAARERTSGGATLIAGLPTGILALDLHHDLFQITRSRTLPAPAAP
jgi:WD40 repeat protein